MSPMGVVEIDTNRIGRSRGMGGMEDPLFTTLSIENHHHPSTFLSMEPAGGSPHTESSSSPDDSDRDIVIPHRPQTGISRPPPDINLPPSADRLTPPPPLWGFDDILDGSLGQQFYEADAVVTAPKVAAAANGAARKAAVRRGDSIWGAWFFFNFYFKPALSEKSKGKITMDGNGVSGFEQSDLRLEVFLVQHDMENMYMWVFKERPENALGKMQLRSFMNGHSRFGDPQFPFSVEKGFYRSHRMQRKHYRGLSNPQCVHGVEIVRSPNLLVVSELDHKKWVELTGRDLNFLIPSEASDYGSWRNIPSTEFDLERPHLLPMKSTLHLPPKKSLNGSGLNLSSQPPNYTGVDSMDLSPKCSKRRKDFFSNGVDEDCCLPMNFYSERPHEADIHPIEPPWMNDFTGVMRSAYGPVSASKSIYEDEEGYLIIVSLPFADQQKVKVTWRNSLIHGIVKISCVSTAGMPYIKRHDRMFKLTDPAPEHCPPGEFVREIPLPTRIPEGAKLEAYYDESGTVLEIIVPKHQVGPEEHEVYVCLRPPHFGANELLLS